MAADLLGFVVLGFSLSVPVGAITIEMVKRGMHGGFWPAWFVGLGGMSADILLMLLIYFGIAAMLMTAAVQTVMWSIGFIVLVYLGVDSIRAAAAPFDLDPGRRAGNKSLAACFWSGFAIAISNPLNILFWVGIYGAVLSSTLQGKSGGSVLFYSSAIFIGIAIWDAIVAAAVHFGKNFAGHKFMKVFSICAGLALIGFGVYFGWQALQNILASFV